MEPSLEKCLEYKNTDVIYAFCNNLKIDQEEASIIFQDMIRFLWASTQDAEGLVAEIDKPILIIDEMWHTFILFTKQYQEFCFNYLGVFFHHIPTVKNDLHSDQAQPLSAEAKAVFLSRKRSRYAKIYMLLGEDAFKRWFFYYPDKYSRENILSLRRK
ncbi:MAG TPA: hypothetical protein VL995_10020 [Cellvibrio sp.]|nr:hypothetical protein [Cellvibrio sp.]